MVCLLSEKMTGKTWDISAVKPILGSEMKRGNKGRVEFAQTSQGWMRMQSLTQKSEVPKKGRVQSKSIQWNGIKWEPRAAERVRTRNKT